VRRRHEAKPRSPARGLKTVDWCATAWNARPLQGIPWGWSGTLEACQNGQGPDAAESLLLEPLCGTGHVAATSGMASGGAGRLQDSARVVSPPASILDSRTRVKVNFISVKHYPFRGRVIRPPSSSGCDRASTRDWGGTRAVFDLEAARVRLWNGSGRGSGKSTISMIRVDQPRVRGEADDQGFQPRMKHG
jgi:hypothetical protein